MNILNKLTIKHLMMNKKRTIVTIIGIILSTALMVGIGMITSTFVGYTIEEIKLMHGSHHVQLMDVDSSQIKYIKNNTDIATYAAYHEIGYAYLPNSQNEYKPYLYIIGANKAYLETSKLIDGRLPNNNTEIVISSHISSNGKIQYEIGENITLNIGHRYLGTSSEEDWLQQYNPYIKGEQFIGEEEKEYTIVGIINRRYDEPYSAPGYTVLTYEEEVSDVKNQIFVTYKQVNNVIKKTEKILSLIDIDIETEEYNAVHYNDSLLGYYGQSTYESVNNMVLGIVAIILTLIMLGCAIVIYNSFSISVMERKKQFGLFSSIGATKKQLRKTVFYEAFIVSLIGIPIGIVSGIFGIWVVVEIMNILFPNMEPKIALIIIPEYILVPAIYMIITVIISAFIPSRSAAKISPTEAIRLNDDIKINKRKIKISNVSRKIFGIEGELALKNMKRNKKKYRITILSLVVSIVLFLSFSAFLQYGLKSTNTVYAVKEYDISLSFSQRENLDNYKKVLSELKGQDSIKKLASFYTINTISNTPDEHTITREILWRPKHSKEYKKYNENSSAVTRSNSDALYFLILPDDEYANYIKKLNLDSKKYNGDEIIILCNNSATYYDHETNKFYEYAYFDTQLKELNITLRSYKERYIVADNDVYVDKQVKIPITLVDQSPSLMVSTPQFIISDKMYQKLQTYYPNVDYFAPTTQSIYSYINMQVKDATKAEKDILGVLNIKSLENNDDYYLENIKEKQQTDRNIILFVSILLYGFIALVTLIGVTSVFNTINTSIALRRKEFAVLRSLGLTPKGFNKMICYESLLYGLKALIIGIPISIGVMFLIKDVFSNMVSFTMYFPIKAFIFCILGVFFITFITMMYASKKVKKENILDAIREENI